MIAVAGCVAQAEGEEIVRRARVDVVVGNWRKPPDDLHMARLFGDEVVSLVAKDHPAVRRGWDIDTWLAAEHSCA